MMYINVSFISEYSIYKVLVGEAEKLVQGDQFPVGSYARVNKLLATIHINCCAHQRSDLLGWSNDRKQAHLLALPNL